MTSPNVLVAMNAAALKADLHRLQPGGTLIINEDSFSERDLEKAGYVTDNGPNGETVNPLEDGSLNGYRVLKVPMTSLTKEVCEPLGVKPRDAERSKNFFALGLVSWMYTRPVEPTEEWIDEKFAKSEQVAAANKAAFRAGFNFGETTEAVGHRYEVRPATLPAGTYTSITGNTALSWGLIAAGQLSKLPITLGSYPITPASDILHELSKHKHFGIRTVQAEDEIAAVGVALGAVVRRAPRNHHHQRARRRAQERDHLVGRRHRAPDADHRHPARRPVDGAARPRPRRATSISPCTDVTASRRSP